MCADGNDESTASAMQKFIDEALTMREFNHDHVLRLLGIVIDGDQSPLVVLPFMTHGDVLSYIRNENNVSHTLLHRSTFHERTV